MPPLSRKQAYVLENLERIEPFPYKLETRDQHSRYQLDGWDCTAQITGLSVRARIVKRRDGRIEKRPMLEARS